MIALGRQLIRKFGGGKLAVRRAVSSIPFKAHVATIVFIGGIFVWVYGFNVIKSNVKELITKDTFVYHQEMDDFLHQVGMEQQKVNRS